MSSITVQLRIAEITEPRFFIQALPASVTAENVRKEAVFQVGLNFVQLIETGQVGILADTKIVMRNNPTTVLMHSVVQVVFDIGGVDLLSGVKESNHASIPVDVAQSIVATTYSTIRGILHSRCAGSHLQRVILPLADPMTFLDKNRMTEGPIQPAPPLLED